MLSSSASPSVFDTLPTRPPTPPHDIADAVDDAISFLDDSKEIERATASANTGHKPKLAASEWTPSSSQDTASAANLGKKVGFSPHPVYHEGLLSAHLNTPGRNSLRDSPSSSRSAKPLKSILKQSFAPPPLTPDDDTKLSYFSPGQPGSFAKMLKSAIHQLASQSRQSRLDAYLALNGAMKTYEDVPDIQAMVQNMALVTQFLARDIMWKDTDGNLDINIVTQAMKLVAAIFFDSNLTAAVDSDFKAFLMDRSIAVIEQPEMPKAVVKIHMYLLAQPRFHGQTIASEKAEKIVSALQTIENRCSGNNVIATRLVVYQRMLERSQNVMLRRIRDWLEHIFHGMLSSIKDVRVRAIETCMQAGLISGQQPHAGKALTDMFDSETEDGQTYSEYLSLRLISMISDKTVGTCVPQIWSAVILFFRSKRLPLEKWSKLHTWLHIIQKCLNSSDVDVRCQANLAWNKLVFAIMPNASTTTKMIEMIKLPIAASMEKKGGDKYSKQVRHFALESYYMLLHYALRPSLTHEELDRYWDLLVDPIFSNMVKAGNKGRSIACGILKGLLTANTGAWNSTAALEVSAIKPSELPALDPKWTRSRLAKIAKLVEPIAAASLRQETGPGDLFSSMWLALSRSLSEAGSQEVRTTNDLKSAIAVLANMLRQIWNGCSEPLTGVQASSWLKRYVSLIDVLVELLGPGPFAEDILSASKSDDLEVAPTPSHRPSKHHSVPRSPMVFLIGQFYHSPSALTVDPSFQDAMSTLLSRFVSSKPDSTAKLELLSKSLRTWSHNAGVDDAWTSCRIWAVVARISTSILSGEDSPSSGQESQAAGYGLRAAVDILIHGLSAPVQPEMSDIIEYYNVLLRATKSGAGDSGAVIALIEPLAKALKSSESKLPLPLRLQFATHLLESAAWPRSRQVFDQARKALWGVGLAGHKGGVFDPFDNVYALEVEVLTAAYHGLKGNESETISGHLTAVVDFLGRAPVSALPTALRKIQDGLAFWVQDDARATGTNTAISGATSTAWDALLRLLVSLPSTDSALLNSLEPLLSAGFSSPQKRIVYTTIVFWNKTFGAAQSLEYPPKLENILRARNIDADISLPTFPDSNGEDDAASLPELYESQTQLEPRPSGTQPPTAATSAAARVKEPSAPPQAQSMYFTAPRSPKHHQRNKGSSSRKSGSSTPRARLRHDDSQVQFAPIANPISLAPEESQHLTEHQQEVRARQHGEAQIFPDMSSSPLAQSTALQRNLPRRPDFNMEPVDGAEEDEPGTPPGLPDANAPLSDDIPSSPTPSSQRPSSQRAMAHDGEEGGQGKEAQDPPSSPPRLDADEWQTAGLEDTTVDVADFAPPIGGQGEDRAAGNEGHSDGRETDGDVQFDSTAPEFPSDSTSPNEQLHQEENAATKLDITAPGPEPAEPQSDLATSKRSQQENATASGQTKEVSEERPEEQRREEPKASQTSTNKSEGQEDVSRIEDSFVEPAEPAHGANDAASFASSQASPRKARKRKRKSNLSAPPKKRSSQSPFINRFFSNLFGHSQEHEDEDIGEEIVVASSQSSQPVEDAAQKQPAAKVPKTSKPKPNKTDRAAPEGAEPSSQPQPKSKSKSKSSRASTPDIATSQTSQISKPSSSRSLKRKASNLSNATNEPASQSARPTSAGEDERPPAKTPKKRVRSNAFLIDEARASQEAVDTADSASQPRPSSRGRRASHVVVESPGYQALNGPAEARTADAEVVDNAEGEGEGERDATPRRNQRPIATPRSIIGRLRTALVDLKGMVFSSVEEREFDDVLFELRREAFDAGRRGRVEE